MIRVGIEEDSDEELTPTLEDLYSDELLSDEEVTPINNTQVLQVPGAPSKPTLVAPDSNNNNNNSLVPLSSGAVEVPPTVSPYPIPSTYTAFEVNACTYP